MEVAACKPSIMIPPVCAAIRCEGATAPLPFKLPPGLERLRKGGPSLHWALASSALNLSSHLTSLPEIRKYSYSPTLLRSAHLSLFCFFCQEVSALVELTRARGACMWQVGRAVAQKTGSLFLDAQSQACHESEADRDDFGHVEMLFQDQPRK